jgi:hypothetical protein
MSKLLLYNSLFLILSALTSCSLVEDEPYTNSELKGITVEVISELPISNDETVDYFSVYSYYGNHENVNESVLSNLEPNQIGQNTIVQVFSIPAYTNPPSNQLYPTVVVQVRRRNYRETDSDFEFIHNCGDVTVKVYADGELFQTDTLEMGGHPGYSSCNDMTYRELFVFVP